MRAVHSCKSWLLRSSAFSDLSQCVSSFFVLTKHHGLGHLVPTSAEPFHHIEDIFEFSGPVHKTTKVVNIEIILVQNDQIGNVMFI